MNYPDLNKARIRSEKEVNYIENPMVDSSLFFNKKYF